MKNVTIEQNLEVIKPDCGNDLIERVINDALEYGDFVIEEEEMEEAEE